MRCVVSDRSVLFGLIPSNSVLSGLIRVFTPETAFAEPKNAVLYGVQSEQANSFASVNSFPSEAGHVEVH